MVSCVVGCARRLAWPARKSPATPVGATVRTTAKVVAVEPRVIRFEVEAFDDKRRIGSGRHARGLVETAPFVARLGGK